MYTHVGDWCVSSLPPSFPPSVVPFLSHKIISFPLFSPPLPPFRDTSKKPRENLEAILGISFPTPPAAATAAKRGGEQEGWQQEYVEECCICYAYRLEDEEGKEGGGRQGMRAGVRKRAEEDFSFGC